MIHFVGGKIQSHCYFTAEAYTLLISTIFTFTKKKLKCHSRTLIGTLDKLYYCKILSAEIRYGIKCQNVSVDALCLRSPSAIAERLRDASCLSVVSFSSTIPRALSFIYLRQRSR